MAVQSIRAAMLDVLKQGLLYVLADTDDMVWGLTENAIVSEPTHGTMGDSDVLSMRILDYNRRLTATPDMTSPERTVWPSASVIRITAIGARAWGWLDAFLLSLLDEDVMEWFTERGFSVEPDDDGGGITDASVYVGDREQLRGVASVAISCRAIRDRVIVGAETIEVTFDLNANDLGGTFVAPEED